MGVINIFNSNVGGSLPMSFGGTNGALVRIKPLVDMEIKGIYASVASEQSRLISPRIYRGSTLVAKGPEKLGTTVAGGEATYFPLDSVVTLNANQIYYVGVYSYSVTVFSKGVGTETVSNVTFEGGTYSPDNFGSIWGNSFGIGLERVVNNPPTLKLMSPPENLLGTDGNCESTTKFTTGFGASPTTYTTSTDHVYGSYSIEYKASGSSARMRPITLTAGKYYLLACDAKSSDGLAQITAAIRKADTSYIKTAKAAPKAFTFDYKAFIADGTEQNVGFFYTPSGGSGTGYIDGIRLYEIDKATYDKIDVDPEYTGLKLAQKFPYTDPTISQTLVEGNTYVIAGTATEDDAGNVVTVKYKIDDGSTYNITASVSDGTTPINFSKTLTYLNNRLYDGQNPVTPILDDNVTHKLTVWAEDDQGGKSPESTRNFTVLYNQPPQISGSDQDLGSIAVPPSIPYSVTDLEGYSFTITEAIDGNTIRSFPGVDGQQETLTIPADIWLTLQPDVTHQLTITATDQYNASSKRTFTFKRTVEGIELETIILPADAKPTRTILSLNGQFPAGTNLNVLVCNNAHDPAPTWEDMTTSVLNNRPYVFTNGTSTSGQWGIKFKISIMPGA